MRKEVTEGVSIDTSANETTIKDMVAFIRWSREGECFCSGWAGHAHGPPSSDVVAEALACLVLTGCQLTGMSAPALMLAVAAMVDQLGVEVVHNDFRALRGH